MNFSDRSSSPRVFISAARFVQLLSHSLHFLDQHQLSAHQRGSICGGGCRQAVLFLLGASCCTSPLSRGLERRTAALELQLSRPFTATSTARRGSIRSESSLAKLRLHRTTIGLTEISPLQSPPTRKSDVVTASLTISRRIQIRKAHQIQTTTIATTTPSSNISEPQKFTPKGTTADPVRTTQSQRCRSLQKDASRGQHRETKFS